MVSWKFSAYPLLLGQTETKTSYYDNFYFATPRVGNANGPFRIHFGSLFVSGGNNISIH